MQLGVISINSIETGSSWEIFTSPRLPSESANQKLSVIFADYENFNGLPR